MKNYTFYHYTRNFAEKIKAEGLKVLNWNEYRFEIYNNIPEEYKQDFSFLLAGNLSLDLKQNEVRENRIHLTTVDYDNSPLQYFYGGEYLRKLIEINYPELKENLFKVLKNIGEPLRIKILISESLIDPIYLENLKQIEVGAFSGGKHTDIYLKENISFDCIDEVLILSISTDDPCLTKTLQ